MYKTYIKDKHSLVDLARYGSKSRKNVHSDVLIGEHPPFPMFKEGDILDANATLNLVNCIYDQGKIYKTLSAKIETLEDQITENTNQHSSGIQLVFSDQEESLIIIK